MADQHNTARAFIIGDLEKGLTIVVTDPVMIVNYSINDLMNGASNSLKGLDTTLIMAAIVREMLPILRGVNLDEAEVAAAQFDAGRAGAMTPAQERAVFTELDFASTIAQIVNAKGSVNTVDFCIALDIDPADFTIMFRSVNPGRKIVEYLQDPANSGNHPQVFPIDGLRTDGLDIPPRWEERQK